MSALPNAALEALPAGELRSLVLHWTGYDYVRNFPAYHFCAGLDSRALPALVATNDLRANMRDVRAAGATYAAHTRGRNSFAIGLAVCAMAGSTPHDFGAYPLREDLIALACGAAARLCAFYAIPVERAHVYTHAEAALEDGYFGAGEEERWDIARLHPSPHALEPSEACAAGDYLRDLIRAAQPGTGVG